MRYKIWFLFHIMYACQGGRWLEKSRIKSSSWFETLCCSRAHLGGLLEVIAVVQCHQRRERAAHNRTELPYQRKCFRRRLWSSPPNLSTTSTKKGFDFLSLPSGTATSRNGRTCVENFALKDVFCIWRNYKKNFFSLFLDLTSLVMMMSVGCFD